MGDPACWLANVCPDCGRFLDEPFFDGGCPHCGAEPPDEPSGDRAIPGGERPEVEPG
jgi:hypothetical protein